MRATLIALLGVTVLLAGACSSSDTSTAQRETRGLAHIHGLGVNPVDGALYAGTHYGLYRLAAGRDPELVGDIVQDFMGFTVAGPDHFLGSGHPGEDARDTAPNLGLIESTNSGQSWTSVSLNGEVDFHTLDYRHGLVYGLDSGSRTLMLSADKRTWDRRAAISAADIAVSPQNPNEILATTADGVMRSLDQGKTFTPLGAQAQPVLLSWPDDGPLIGVDPIGTVYASDDAGTTWQARRALGERPQAVLAAGGGQVFVATESGIHRSTDNATTFEVFYGFNTR
ncbi:F510_1955 family glycosylhydrolase [Mycolicibacterium cosmeticum]|uniref:F510_1955 family glycosylhydrolase n=1 Tax=Mycolicibacterium cosmeticum TaxID=258533 RepID=UPI003204C9B2